MDVNANSGGALSGVGLIKTATDIQARDVTKVLESADVSKLQSTPVDTGSNLTGLGQNLDIKT